MYFGQRLNKDLLTYARYSVCKTIAPATSILSSTYKYYGEPSQYGRAFAR